MPKIGKMLHSFKYAAKGIVFFVKNNNNFKFHLIAAFLVFLFAIFFKVSLIEACILILCIALVLSLEVFNTSIELLCDFLHPDYNEKIGRIKDLTAAAVLIVSIGAAIVAGIIFIPKIWTIWIN